MRNRYKKAGKVKRPKAPICNSRRNLRVDPTRSITQRRAMAVKVKRAFARLKLEVVRLVAEQDVFGLKARLPLSFLGNAFCPTGQGGGVDPTCSPAEGVKAVVGAYAAASGRTRLLIETALERAGYLVYDEKTDSTVPGKPGDKKAALRDLQEGLATSWRDATTTDERATLAPLMTGVGMRRVGGEVGSVVEFDGSVHQNYPGAFTGHKVRVAEAGWSIPQGHSEFVPVKARVDRVTTNVFCPTGKGGGIDPTCPVGGKSVTKTKTSPPPPKAFKSGAAAEKALAGSASQWSDPDLSDYFANRYVKRYAGTSDSFRINDCLRRGCKDKQLGETIDGISKALDKTSFPADVQVFRSINAKTPAEKAAILSSFEVGKEFTDRAFVSTTANQKYADDWATKMGGKDTIQVSVTVLKGSKAAYLPKTHVGKQEWEVLIQRGSRFRVNSVTESGVELELLPDQTENVLTANEEDDGDESRVEGEMLARFHWDADFLQASMTENAFCPTGDGGGVDPTCSPGGGGGGGKYDSMSKEDLLDEVIRIKKAAKGLTDPKAVAESDGELKKINDELHRRWLRSLNKPDPPTGNAEPEDWDEFTENVFCPTGEGGGVDPTCSPGSGGNGGNDGSGKIKDKHGTEYVVKFDGDRTYSISVPGKEDLQDRGVTAGAVTLKRNKTAASSVGIHPEFQRRGLATALYDHIEKHLGYSLEENWATTPDGEAFWKARKSRDLASNADPEDWRFRYDPEKVLLFQEWLRRQLQLYVLGRTEEELWDRYVNEGFLKGAGRSYDDATRSERFLERLREAGEALDFTSQSRRQFLESAFRQPEAVAKVKLLAGRTFTDLKGVTEAMSTAMTRTLTDGLVQGHGPREVARALARDVEQIGQTRALTIARTEFIRAHAEGQLHALDRLGVEEVGAAVEWSTSLDERVCELCAPLEGVVLKIAEARGMLPRHPNCLLPGNYVQGKIVAALEARYSGEAVEILTADGCRVTVTVNHPVLSVGGFVPAGEVKEGDDLLSYHRQPELPGPGVQDSPTLVEEVFKSFSRPLVEEPCSAFDFDGDEESMVGEVKVVLPDLSLRELVAEDREGEHQALLMATDDGGVGRLGLSHPLLISHRLPLQELGLTPTPDWDTMLQKPKPYGFPPNPGRLGDGQFGLATHVPGTDVSLVDLDPVPHHTCLGLASELDTVFSQPTPDGIAFNSEFIPQLLERFPTRVTASKVTHVRRFHYEGPVYDVETVPGYFTASQGGMVSIITQNCRCAWVPANVGEDQSASKTTKGKIDKAVKTSTELGSKKDQWRVGKPVGKVRPQPVVNVDPSLLDRFDLALNNCGTGAGGFKPGNSCAGGGGTGGTTVNGTKLHSLDVSDRGVRTPTGLKTTLGNRVWGKAEDRLLAEERADGNLFREGTPTERVKIKDLIATQPVVIKEVLDDPGKGEGKANASRPIEVVRYRGEMFVQDGTHRVVRSLLSGGDEVDAIVYVMPTLTKE